MLKDLLIKSRSYRRFFQDQKVKTEELLNIIANLRLIPSAANFQPLRYVIVNKPSLNEKIFANLGWAAYIKDWSGPSPGERPAAYIIMSADRKSSPYVDIDAGIALQTIILSGSELGYGCCAIASFNKNQIREIIALPETLDPILVIAIGKPKEKVVIEIVKDNDIRYYRDKHQTHHVPKREAKDLLHQVFE